MPKISALPAASSVGAADLFAIVQSGTTKKATASLVLTYVQDNITVPAASLSGVVALANGGTAKAITASNGVVVWCDANSFELTAVGSAGQFLTSNGAAAPTWTTSTFPSSAGAAGNILISNGTNYIASTSLWPNTVGAAGKILRSDGTTNAYSTATFADTYAVSTLLYAGSANAVSGLATANSSVLLTNSTGVPAWSGALTNGQVIIGSTGATPVAATIQGAGGISIANGAGTITISGGGGGYSWNEVTGTSQAMAVDTGYVANNAGLVTLTLPAIASFGDTVIVQGKGAGGWLIAQNAGQTIHFGSVDTTTGVGGSLASTNRYDSVELLCITANTDWAVVTGAQGILTVV